MTDFQINDYLLSQEAEGIAKDALDQAIDDLTDSETTVSDLDADDIREHCSDYIHQTVDGHQWVIYHYQALKLCADCRTDDGEAFLEDVGMPENPTFYQLASMIAYGELRARAESELEDLISEIEDAESA